MVRIKDNTIDLSCICPQIAIVLPTLDSLIGKYDVDLVITCGREGKHSNTSLHYAGRAIDFRNRGLSADQRAEFVDAARRYLNNDFDLVNESNHFHLEYQPKYKGV